MIKKLIITGGFLGAGKTTLLYQISRLLAGPNSKIGIITNDQAPDLVDSAVLADRADALQEVAGSCFCCNFDGLVSAIDRLDQAGVHYIFAEPVGSCTDLAATVMSPLKDKFPDLPLAPLTVLLDPKKLPEILQSQPGNLDQDALYIQYLQLAEADMIVINKIDQLTEDELNEIKLAVHRKFPQAEIFTVSALNKWNLQNWLDIVLNSVAGKSSIVEVDYDRYAHGEAVLGWLNAKMTIRKTPKTNWETVAKELMKKLHKSFCAGKHEIGHVKILLQSGSRLIAANLVNLQDVSNPRGAIDNNINEVTLFVNARVQCPSQELQTIVEAALKDFDIGNLSLQCLTPGRPKPTHRYQS